MAFDTNDPDIVLDMIMIKIQLIALFYNQQIVSFMIINIMCFY